VPVSAVVTNASTSTVTDARTNVLTAATADGTKITYTSSRAHGLSNGDSITVSGFGGTLSPTPNRTGVVTVVDGTTFTIPAVGAASGTATGTGSITGRVYYITSVVNGLLAGDTVTISGLTTFNVSGKTVLAASGTTFVISDTTTGTAETGKTGTIAGIIYYTTNSAHGFTPGLPGVNLTGITGTPAFNLSLATIYRAPSSTVFMVQSSVTGTAVTSQSGVLTYSIFTNQTTVINQNARVQARQVVQQRSNPDALSTLSFAGTSGALSSSRFNRPGGLPTGFKNSQGTYTRIPQNAGWIQGGAGTVSSGPKRF
jgi:hypothetical protein